MPSICFLRKHVILSIYFFLGDFGGGCGRELSVGLIPLGLLSPVIPRPGSLFAGGLVGGLGGGDGGVLGLNFELSLSVIVFP